MGFDRKQEEEEQQLKAQVAEERRQRKAERHQARQLRRLKREEAQRMNYKIAVEERKLLIAQRKLESIRLLDELFERVKVSRFITFRAGFVQDLVLSTISILGIPLNKSLLSLFSYCD